MDKATIIYYTVLFFPKYLHLWANSPQNPPGPLFGSSTATMGRSFVSISRGSWPLVWCQFHGMKRGKPLGWGCDGWLDGWILATFLAPNFGASFLGTGKWHPFRDGWCFRSPAVVTSWGWYLRQVLAPSQVAFFAGFLNHHQYFREI